MKAVLITSLYRAHWNTTSLSLRRINLLRGIQRVRLAATTSRTLYAPCQMAWRCGSLLLNSVFSITAHLRCQGTQLTCTEALASAPLRVDQKSFFKCWTLLIFCCQTAFMQQPLTSICDYRSALSSLIRWGTSPKNRHWSSCFILLHMQKRCVHTHTHTPALTSHWTQFHVFPYISGKLTFQKHDLSYKKLKCGFLKVSCLFWKQIQRERKSWTTLSRISLPWLGRRSVCWMVQPAPAAGPASPPRLFSAAAGGQIHQLKDDTSSRLSACSPQMSDPLPSPGDRIMCVWQPRWSARSSFLFASHLSDAFHGAADFLGHALEAVEVPAGDLGDDVI